MRHLLLCCVLVLMAAAAHATTLDDTMQKLAAAAEKPGNIIWYESSPDDQAQKIATAFRKRFPTLTIQHIRDTGGNSIGARIIQESQGGTRTADVVTTGAAIKRPLTERGLLRAIDAASLGLSPELAPTAYGVVTTAVVYVIIYNSDVVSPADAPKQWTDLLNPKWDGKLGIWVRGEGQGALSAAWGVDKVADYVRKMNALHPNLLQSTFPLAQQIAAGESEVGFTLYHSAQPALRRGAPIKVVVADPVPAGLLYSMVPVKSQNPDGGLLLSLWLATDEGAKAYEDATDRGNPYIQSTRTYALLKGHKVSEYPPSQSDREAAAVDKFNKMIEARETE
ncbi:MAG TPA: ABC transporter substrate-binding protein [Bryobacteraceae bacterium]